MPRSYPPEFRRRVLDLIDAGRSVTDLADELGVSNQTIYSWRNQELIDRGERPGLTSTEAAGLVAARKRIAEFGDRERHPASRQRAAEAGRLPKRRFEAIAVMASEGLPAQAACGLLEVSESGCYAWKLRPPSAHSVRHRWLTELVAHSRSSSVALNDTDVIHRCRVRPAVAVTPVLHSQVDARKTKARDCRALRGHGLLRQRLLSEGT